MDAVFQRLGALWQEAWGIWLAGGWAMVAIAVIALVMFGVGVWVWIELRVKGFLSVSEKRWRRWIDDPAARKGPIGRLLDSVTAATSIEEAAVLFEQLRAKEMTPLQRDLRLMRICVSAAPLVGLLGTVSGMLVTFDALATGSGGDKTMAMIAGGISEALITTETGLVVALPGLFFQYQLVRSYERYEAFLAHLETVFTQVLYKRQQREIRARRAAFTRLAHHLQRAVS